MQRDFFLTIGAKIFAKLMPKIWKNLWAINLALKQVIEPSEWYFTLKTHLEPICFWSLGSFSNFYVLYNFRLNNFLSIASFHYLLYIRLFTTSSYILGLYTLLLVLMIDMVCSIDGSTLVVIVGLSRILRIFSTIFLGLPQGLDLLAGTFCFIFKIVVAVFTGHFNSAFAP